MKAHLGPYIAVTTGFILAIIAVAPLVFTLGYYAAPELQGRFFPVVDISLLNSGRADDIDFWEVSFHKRYTAQLKGIDFYVVTSTNQHIPLRAFRCDANNIELKSEHKGRKAGEVWRSRYCFVVTPDIDSQSGIQVEGFSTYSVWPYWWTTRQRTISLTLPGSPAGE